MKLQNVRLRGFIGVKEGMGLDEIQLDLSGLSGLVALDGTNGAGKTTVLENLQPLRCLASRKGALSNHVYLRDSEKEISFSYGGDVYRTLIKIDAESGRQEGFIWRNGVSLVNGKVRDYDRSFGELLGSQNLFFNSIFCAQDSERINELTTSQFKTLLSEFLRLQDYVDREETAKMCGNVLGGRKERIQRDIEQCEKDIAAQSFVPGVLLEKRATLKEHEARLGAARGAVRDAEEALALAREHAAKNHLLRDHIHKLELTKPGLVSELEKCAADAEVELGSLRLKWQTVGSDIRLAENILQDRDGIIAARDDLAALSAQLESMRSDKQQIQTDVLDLGAKADKNQACRNRITSLTKEKALAGDEAESITLDYDSSVKIRAEKLQTVKKEIAQCQTIVGKKAEINLAVQEIEELKEDIQNHKESLNKASLSSRELDSQIAARGAAFESLRRDITALNDDPRKERLSAEIKFNEAAALNISAKDPDCTSTVCGAFQTEKKAIEALPGLKNELAAIMQEIEEKRSSLFDQQGKITAEVKRLEGSRDYNAMLIDTLKNSIAACEAEIASRQGVAALVSKLEIAEVKIGDLEKRKAEILEDSDRAKERFEKQRDSIQARIIGMENEIKAAKESLVDGVEIHFSTAKRDLIDMDRKIKAHQNQILTVEAMAGKMRDLEMAEAKILGLKKWRAELAADGEAARARWDSAKAAIESRIATLNSEVALINDKINIEAERAVEINSAAVLGFQGEMSRLEDAIKQISSDIAVLSNKEAELKANVLTLSELNAKRALIEKEIAEWQYLKFACGKDGLRALEIDNAAPTISTFANNLLSETFGTTFSIRFRTQDDEGKECLDIFVSREDGREVLLENMSGGEKVWILKALRLSQTMLSKEKSGRAFETLFCDEEDGQLSRDNALNFVKLYRETLKMAGMNTCFYISHKPEALSLADHRLVFNHGIHVE